MRLKQPVYEVCLKEAIPKALNFSLKSLKIVIYGFSEEYDRFTQIEEALKDQYVCHTPAAVTLMRPEKLKSINKTIKKRQNRPLGMPNGVLVLPLEAKWPNQNGDNPKTLI